jgi:hypothetical protein
MGKKQLDELKVGGGATGVSDSGPGPTGGTATLPASKKQGDGMEKIQDPNSPGMEATSTENNTAPTGDMSAKNRASVAMKASAASGKMAEEVKAMFAGTEISEELLGAATALFEQVVETRVLAIAEDLEAQYNEALEEEYQRAAEEIAEAVDAYIDHTAQKFIEENALEIESSVRVDVAESFLAGLKSLFEEHYIDVPDEAADVVEELVDRVAELEEKLNESMNESAELRKFQEEVLRSDVVAVVAEGLTVTQQEKFATLAEGVEFDGDVDSYKTKLESVKSSYFSEGKKAVQSSITESATAPVVLTEDKVPASGAVSRYVAALDRTLKK